MRSTWPWRLLLALLVVVVAVLALSPNPAQGPQLGWDKLNHALAFAAMAFCAVMGRRGGSRRQLATVLVALLAYGGLIELLQLFVPGREAEWGDWLADAVGIAIGALLAAAWQHGRGVAAVARS
jgi:VanZ family protein